MADEPAASDEAHEQQSEKPSTSSAKDTAEGEGGSQDAETSASAVAEKEAEDISMMEEQPTEDVDDGRDTVKEEEIVEEDPEEEEVVTVAKKKRKRLRARDFVDDIAEDEDDPDAPVDDEDEDGEDLDQYEEEDERELEDEEDIKPEVKRQRRMEDEEEDLSDDDRMHAAVDQEREEEEARRMAEMVNERWGTQGNEIDDLRNRRAEINTMSRAQLLPSIRDPKLFLVRCDPGMEENMVLALMMKYVKRKHHPDFSQRLYIHCAFTTPSSKGYIYVEADKEHHVKMALQGLRALKCKYPFVSSTFSRMSI